MNKNSTPDQWRISSKLGITIIGILLGGAISFNAWAVASMYERPTREQVKEMIEDKSPYKADRTMILQALTRVEKSNEQLTKTISELKTEIVKWKMQTSHGR